MEQHKETEVGFFYTFNNPFKITVLVIEML